ncbi:MAG: DUF456 domain-containing protein [Psychroflexus sp.]
MTIFLLSLGFLCCILGIIGSFLPVLPGPPISWLGFLFMFLAPDIDLSFTFLWVTFAVAALIFILDYIVPVLGTKRYGGSKFGVYGTSIGLVVGLFFPPFGILIGPFVGAFLGEIIFNKSNSKSAFRSAWGSFLGFLASTFMKFMTALVFTGMYVYKLIEFREIIF